MAIIQCPGCGSNISDQAVQCPKCGQTLNGGASVSTPMEMEEIKKFNWGAFGLWPIWGFANGMWWLFLVNIVFSFLPLSYIFLWCFNIYMGMNGGKLAWKQKNWKGISHFVSVQNSWKVWGIVFFVLQIIGTFVLILMEDELYY